MQASPHGDLRGLLLAAGLSQNHLAWLVLFGGFPSKPLAEVTVNDAASSPWRCRRRAADAGLHADGRRTWAGGDRGLRLGHELADCGLPLLGGHGRRRWDPHVQTPRRRQAEGGSLCSSHWFACFPRRQRGDCDAVSLRRERHCKRGIARSPGAAAYDEPSLVWRHGRIQLTDHLCFLWCEGRAKVPSAILPVCCWILGFPCSYFLSRSEGVTGICEGLMIGYALATICLFFFFFRSNWEKLTQEASERSEVQEQAS
mmetsp:Transcript_104690/g.249270  ORF Transcript_104690/g.249270 Transcript_104690/m.249270 type:complete len:257 (+) Transcript_104690:706-1476(+)